MEYLETFSKENSVSCHSLWGPAVKDMYVYSVFLIKTSDKKKL